MAMADTLESVNGSNAKSKTVQIRVIGHDSTSPTATMSVFTTRLISSTGHYTIGENVVFGEAKKREDKIKELKKKWPDQSTWTLSSMTVKKKQDRYHGCPHGWIINLGAPGLKAAALKGSPATVIPDELEPPLTTSDLTAYGTSQVVDFHAFVMMVAPQETRKDKDLVEVTLADGAKVVLPMNFWQEMIPNVPKDIEKKVLYTYGAYLVKKGDSLHLTPRKDTRFAVATGQRPLAKALLGSGIASASMTDQDVTRLSKGSSRDFKTGPAIAACIGDVELSMMLKKDMTDLVFESPAVLLALEDPDQLLTQDGERIYTQVSISDFGADRLKRRER